MGMLSDQLRQVLRRLGRAPLFTIVTLITLGVGVGANTVIFSVLNGVLLKPLPYPHPEELIGIWHTAPGVNLKELNTSPSMHFTYRDNGQSFQSLGLYNNFTVSITGLAEPEEIPSIGVTYGTLETLGVAPALGR